MSTSHRQAKNQVVRPLYEICESLQPKNYGTHQEEDPERDGQMVSQKHSIIMAGTSLTPPIWPRNTIAFPLNPSRYKRRDKVLPCMLSDVCNLNPWSFETRYVNIQLLQNSLFIEDSSSMKVLTAHNTKQTETTKLKDLCHQSVTRHCHLSVITSISYDKKKIVSGLE